MTSHFDKTSYLAPVAEGWLLEFTVRMQLPSTKLESTLFVGAFPSRREADAWFNAMRTTLRTVFVPHTLWHVDRGYPASKTIQNKAATLHGSAIIRKIDAKEMVRSSDAEPLSSFLVVPPTCPHAFARSIRDIALERIGIRM